MPLAASESLRTTPVARRNIEGRRAMSTQESDLAARVERFRALENGTSLEAALDFYDSLPPVGVEELLGSWRGSGLPTGNPLDGLLERFGWYGKRFDDPETVYPLVFRRSDG